ncbi:S-adenosyl-L-methionine-dependent methyltransferase, partial [Mycena sanguinolenta]
RLDEMHLAVTRYLGGKLSFAPIADIHPRKILELGCGSGAWCSIFCRAIQAGEEFPEAEVVGVDISPLPTREIPRNMSFELMDLTKEWVWENETFDVVHARFVMMHVPNAENVIKRAAQLLKPGGFLLLEDPGMNRATETGGPALQRSMSHFLQLWRSRAGADPELGRKFGDIITSTGYFPGVHDYKISVPLAGTGPDEAMNELGRALNKSWIRRLDITESRMVAQGLVPDPMLKEQKELLEDSNCTAMVDVYFCWAQRAL